MSILLEIHQVVAFLAVLCAIIFSWNAMGRRVVNAVLGLQLLLGLAVAGVMGSQRQPLAPEIWGHIFVGIAALVAYGLALRFGKQAGGASRALAFSVAGLILVILNVYLGLHMAGMF